MQNRPKTMLCHFMYGKSNWMDNGCVRFGFFSPWGVQFLTEVSSLGRTANQIGKPHLLDDSFTHLNR